jgi:hypothetical protein
VSLLLMITGIVITANDAPAAVGPALNPAQPGASAGKPAAPAKISAERDRGRGTRTAKGGVTSESSGWPE